MRLTMKNERLKRQKKSATENPATHVSGKYELLQQLGQQELLTQMVMFPVRVPRHDLVLRMMVFLKGLRLSLIIGQAGGRKGRDGNTATALGWGSPKDFCPHCATAGSSQPTHRNHQPGSTRA